MNLKKINLLGKLTKISRSKSHPLIHKLHSEHNISKKTLLYIKEYSPHANIPRTIIKESFKILLFAGLLSMLGGFALENIKHLLISIMPLLILFPVLNNMVGSYGAIISSRISTMMHEEGGIKNKFKNKHLKILYLQIKSISLIIVFLAVLLSLIINFAINGVFDIAISGKILIIAVLDVVIITNFLFFFTIKMGIYFYKKGEDPDNFLIPLTTSIADFGNMALLTLLIMLFF